MGSSQRCLPHCGAAWQEFSGCIYLLESKCRHCFCSHRVSFGRETGAYPPGKADTPSSLLRAETQTETTRCRYTDAPCSFLQASFIIQHVFNTEQQIVSGITRQEHVFGYGVLPAKPGTCSVELQFPALTGSKQQPRQQ